MGKTAFCICENKGTDQLRGNHEADQRLCFRFTDSICSSENVQAELNLLSMHGLTAGFLMTWLIHLGQSQNSNLKHSIKKRNLMTFR